MTGALSHAPLSMVDTDCALCGESEREAVLEGADRDHGLPGAFTVVRCLGCGHHRLDPRPADGELGRLYPDDYTPFRGDPSEERRRLTTGVVERLEDLLHLGPYLPMRRGRLLELGCGKGDLLARFAARGWDAVGVEPSESASRTARARGLAVQTGTDDLLDGFEADSFDLLHAFMVVEHTPDPILTLQRLRRVARSGALLRMSVPNFDHWTRRRYGEYWYALHLPRHYQHFSPSSAREALRLAGWEPQRVWYQVTNADLWTSIERRAAHTGSAGPMSSLARFSRAIDIATLPVRLPLVQLGGGSRMTISARPA